MQNTRDYDTNLSSGVSSNTPDQPAYWSDARTQSTAQEFATWAARNTKYQMQMRAQGRGFFWIGALSLINSLLRHADAKIYFPGGLGATQVIDGFGNAFAKRNGAQYTVLALVLELCTVGLFFLFGYFARKGAMWAFVTGMILYTLDALLFLFVKDFLAIVFHGLFLFSLLGGVMAALALSKSKQAQLATNLPTSS